MIASLEEMLCAVTGYAAISLQPNAGSQGEYAGLLVIQAYHQSRGEGHRNICLIPSSAHGTNPASADGRHAGGGYRLRRQRQRRPGRPESQGRTALEEPGLRDGHLPFDPRRVRRRHPELCDIVHSHGGQVYVDGANMNALVGVAAPGAFGGDVSHLNLHKTFCIPHGGGGPGVGPIGVGAHLAKFLPNQRSNGYIRDNAGIGSVSAAPLARQRSCRSRGCTSP
jgi:glycine dehydrogenase